MVPKKSKKLSKWVESDIPIENEKSEKKSKKIAFESWFANKRQSKSVKNWQDTEILTFFKKQGLTKSEERKKYDEVFKRF